MATSAGGPEGPTETRKTLPNKAEQLRKAGKVVLLVLQGIARLIAIVDIIMSTSGGTWLV